MLSQDNVLVLGFQRVQWPSNSNGKHPKADQLRNFYLAIIRSELTVNDRSLLVTFRRSNYCKLNVI